MRNKHVGMIGIIGLFILLAFYIHWKIVSFHPFTRTIHFSIDDTYYIFSDLTFNEERYQSIFENETLAFLQKCHLQYGVKVTMYCFYEAYHFQLSKCTDKFRKEFEENSSWLQFGFHGWSPETDYSMITSGEAVSHYENTIRELKRIVGERSITHVVRLDKYLCSNENAQALMQCEDGIIGLLGAESYDRPNYYLDEEQKQKLENEGYFYDDSNELFFYATDFKLESVDEVAKACKQRKGDNHLIVYTHEILLNNSLQKKIVELFEFAKENQYSFDELKKE